MGKLLTAIFFAALLVCPRWAGAEFKQSGSVFGANFIVARTELGLFVAFSPGGPELDLRTFDPHAQGMQGVSSFFISSDPKGFFNGFVEPDGARKTLGGFAFITLGERDAIAISREAGSPFIAISGDSILITLGSSVLFNASWPELVAAVRSSEGSEAYSFDRSGKLSFAGKPAGLRIGVARGADGTCDRNTAEFVIQRGGSTEASDPGKVPTAGLIALTNSLFLDPETKAVYEVINSGGAGGSSPCRVTTIPR